MSVPKVSVVMSVYNGERYLREAMDSILNQTFRDFEFIIIDDASTDGTAGILQGYDDPRIVLLTNANNIGLTESLNRGLGSARGKYIARMDADDISLPKRLEKQVAYLDAHPEVGLLGTWAEVIDDEGAKLSTLCLPTDTLSIKWFLLFGSCIVHSTAMFRLALARRLGGYGPFRYAQDRDLWLRMSQEAEAVQLPEVLLQCRLHADAISMQLRDQQWGVSTRISQQAISRILEREITLDEATQMRILWLGDGRPVASASTMRGVADLEELFNRFCQRYCELYTGRQYEARLRQLKAQILGRVYLHAACQNSGIGRRSIALRYLIRAVTHYPTYLTNRRVVYCSLEILLGCAFVDMLHRVYRALPSFRMCFHSNMSWRRQQ
jgi:hypothetical protein